VREHHHVRVTEVEFTRAIDSYSVSEISIDVERTAEERMSSAIQHGGILLVGEVHGVLENPRVLYTLMHRFTVTSLGLEWPASMQPIVDQFLEAQHLDYSAIANSADGRITAGHFAVLRALSQEGLLSKLVLFDPLSPYTSWSERDRGMARLLLEGLGPEAALAAAGNLHTQLRPHENGVPMGMHVGGARPHSFEIRLRYASGKYFNFAPKRFRQRVKWPWSRDGLALTWSQSRAELKIPQAHMAAVPAA
jgi:hypothetical protein